MMDAGFQCVVILDFSGVVSSIAISKHLQHVSVGYSSGMVSKLRSNFLGVLSSIHSISSVALAYFLVF